jgi:hypothetical protein
VAISSGPLVGVPYNGDLIEPSYPRPPVAEIDGYARELLTERSGKPDGPFRASSIFVCERALVDWTFYRLHLLGFLTPLIRQGLKPANVPSCMPVRGVGFRVTPSGWRWWSSGRALPLEMTTSALVAQATLPGQTPRLQVSCNAVSLDGANVPLGMTQEARGAALCLLRHLLAAMGDWRSSRELNEMELTSNCSHAEVRWDRVRKHLPAPLQLLIETDRRKGSRLRPSVWHR